MGIAESMGPPGVEGGEPRTSLTALTTCAKAKHAVDKHGPLPVPLHLRNAPTKLMKSLG